MTANRRHLVIHCLKYIHTFSYVLRNEKGIQKEEHVHNKNVLLSQVCHNHPLEISTPPTQLLHKIRFEAPAIVGSRRLGMVHGIVAGETDNEGVIQAIPKRKAEDLIQVIRSGMHGYQSSSTPTHQQLASNSSSLADELMKFAKLKEQGAITEDEYERIKKGLLGGKELFLSQHC